MPHRPAPVQDGSGQETTDRIKRLRERQRVSTFRPGKYIPKHPVLIRDRAPIFLPPPSVGIGLYLFDDCKTASKADATRIHELDVVYAVRILAIRQGILPFMGKDFPGQ
jgi:hypothetical protein